MAKTGNINSSTTQEFLDVYDIVNNFVILKNGTVSIVLTVNSMNFGLLAEAEQDAIIYAYAALLNSLNYPIQIIIQSKTKDATAYLNTLKNQEEKTASANKKELIARYRQFVSELIRERNVLDKKFYVVVPATAIELGIMTAQSVLPGGKKFDITTIEKSILLEKAATTLEPKRDHLLAQFSRIGLYARQMETQEIIQIFYNNYNPESYEGQTITDTNNYTTPLVQAQIIGGNMNFSQPPSNNTLPSNNVAKQVVSPPQTAAAPGEQTMPSIQTTPSVPAMPGAKITPGGQTALGSQTTPNSQTTQMAQTDQINQATSPPATTTSIAQQPPTPPTPGIQESVSSLNIPDAKTPTPVITAPVAAATELGAATPPAATSPAATTSAPTTTSTPKSAVHMPANLQTAPIKTIEQNTPALSKPTADLKPTVPTTDQESIESPNLDLAQNTINQSLQDLGSTSEVRDQKTANQTTKADAGSQEVSIPPQNPQASTDSTKQTSEKMPPLPEI